MRKYLLGAALALASIPGCAKDKQADKTGSAATATDNLPTMTMDDVEKALADKQAVAVDCNGDRTRKKYGVLPGAILTSEEDFPASELPPDKATKLVFYCTDSG
ncbi:MAG TPA: hypothetical protein VFV99_05920 [Kofleriaceae bacterium]|nr:hypothetical protein [Kofleriaceae bacterium]